MYPSRAIRTTGWHRPSLALSQTQVYTARQQIRGLVHRVVCLFTSQLSYGILARDA